MPVAKVHIPKAKPTWYRFNISSSQNAIHIPKLVTKRAQIRPVDEDRGLDKDIN